MPQVVLFPWNTTERVEGRTGWLVSGGNLNTALQAPDQANYAWQSIPLGTNDTNSLDGTDWRQAGGGAFPWVGKTPTQIKVEWDFFNWPPNPNASMAVYLADVPQTFYYQLFGGAVAIAPNAWTWVNIGALTHAVALAALAAGNLHVALIFYNHDAPTAQLGVDCCRLTVDYSGASNQIMWADI